VYRSEERMKQIENEHVLLKNTMPEEPAEEASSDEDAAEESAE